MFVRGAELEKAQHAKHQRAVIDSFLEMRIKLQVCILPAIACIEHAVYWFGRA